MVIKIDFNTKTVAIEQQVTFKQLEQTLKALFPKDYREWKIDTNVKFEISPPPVVIGERCPVLPWTNPVWYQINNVPNTITCDQASNTQLSGVQAYSTMVVDY